MKMKVTWQTTGSAWLLCLLFGGVITDLEHQGGNGRDKSSSSGMQQHSKQNGTNVESPETIRSLNPWVRIPDNWKHSGALLIEDDSSSISSESYPPRASGDSAPSRKSSGGGSEEQHEPYFDHAMMTNLSEQVLNHAFLRCKVKNLGDRTVSWIRRRDFHILTSGRTVYTNDDRFKIRHNDGSEEWTLVIEYVQTRDDGTYECQVPSGRGTISHFFNLNVLVPQAYILGAKEYHVQQGTVISLVCIVENSPRQIPQYLYWYHNNQSVNYGSGVSIQTEPGSSTSGVHTHSRLTVPSAGFQHAGTYTCTASNTNPASVHVYVSEGDKTAAIQRHSGSRFVPHCWTTQVLLLSVSILCSFLYFRLALVLADSAR